MLSRPFIVRQLCAFLGSMLFVALLIDVTSSLSHIVSFPTKIEYRNSDGHEKLTRAFHEMVDSTEFIQRSFEQSTPESIGGPAIYKIPLFGDDCRLRFDSSERFPSLAANYDPFNRRTSDHFVLQVDGATKEDFGWLCRKIYENRDAFQGIDMTNLQTEVFWHANNQPPHPGHNALSAKLAGSHEIEDIFNVSPYKSSRDVLDELSEQGFVVLDDTVKTTKEMHQNLGYFLNNKSGQSEEIRRDTVTFLQRENAQACGLERHFDVLMGIASFLNQNYDFPPSVHNPIAPATASHPLTNPSAIQAAEYGKGDFYVEHSDNSWENGKHLDTRRNYRAFTAILYCNEEWKPSDGGALRIYHDSRELAEAKDAPDLCHYTDVLPQNGRLLIFDSTLVHSVQTVHADKFRRALTLWIQQPIDANVLGEIVDVPV